MLKEVLDLGNIVVKEINEDKKYEDNLNAKYLSAIVECNTNLAKVVSNSIVSESFPIIVGGDHSIALGSIAGVSEQLDNLAVIWVDAHGDLNTFETTPSGNIHGMPLSASIGYGDSILTLLYNNKVKINPKNIFIICARDLDKGEMNLIDKLGLNVWTMDYIHNNGIAKVILELYSKLEQNKINNIHLSFDIDCIDPSYIPGTGTAVQGGITIEQAESIIERIFETNKVKSMDFVEFNSSIENEKTLKNCLTLLTVVAKCIKKNISEK